MNWNGGVKNNFFFRYRTEKAIVFHNIIHAVKATTVVLEL